MIIAFVNPPICLSCKSRIDWQDVIGMRLVLRQPSPVWRTFFIEEITAYRELPRLPPFSVPIITQDGQVRKQIIGNSDFLHCKVRYYFMQLPQHVDSALGDDDDDTDRSVQLADLFRYFPVYLPLLLCNLLNSSGLPVHSSFCTCTCGPFYSDESDRQERSYLPAMFTRTHDNHSLHSHTTIQL